jgi:hypothetical protein
MEMETKMTSCEIKLLEGEAPTSRNIQRMFASVCSGGHARRRLVGASPSRVEDALGFRGLLLCRRRVFDILGSVSAPRKDAATHHPVNLEGHPA